ncbi:MAG: hypothetical protein AAGA96_16730 [Verrucomicrobiota bacterium]
MLENRRNLKWWVTTQVWLIKLWQIRRVLVLVIPYIALLVWLFSAGGVSDARPSEVFLVPTEPLWEKPNEDHWYGTTGAGADLFELSRMAMANSVAIAFLASGIGVSLSLLFVMLSAYEPGRNRFRLLRAGRNTIRLVPSMLMVILLCAGAEGNQIIVILSLAGAVVVSLAPTVALWFEEGESGDDVFAGYALGLTRPAIIANRVVPVVIRRLVGAFAKYVPALILAEMGLSFLGLSGDRISVGAMVFAGRDLLIEAPWMAVYPGITATAVVMMFGILGILVEKALSLDLRTELI